MLIERACAYELLSLESDGLIDFKFQTLENFWLILDLNFGFNDAGCPRNCHALCADFWDSIAKN